jgi:hypothetical protein
MQRGLARRRFSVREGAKEAPRRMSLRIEPALRWLQHFLSREWSLALPIALAFLGVPTLAIALTMMHVAPNMPTTLPELYALSRALPGWVSPAFLAMSLVTMVGALALAALAVVPRVSVREALLLALRRFPIWLAIAVVTGVALIFLLGMLATLLALLGIGNAGLLLVVTAVFVISGCFLVLMVPLVIDRADGPIAALRAGWLLYRRSLLKLGGALCLFWLGVWVVAFALQVGLGSLVLVAARAAGQEALGRLLAILVQSFAAAAHWGAFYLFAAALYRVASTSAASRGI